jgi:hypothetical protein
MKHLTLALMLAVAGAFVAPTPARAGSCGGCPSSKPKECPKDCKKDCCKDKNKDAGK